MAAAAFRAPDPGALGVAGRQAHETDQLHRLKLPSVWCTKLGEDEKDELIRSYMLTLTVYDLVNSLVELTLQTPGLALCSPALSNRVRDAEAQ